MCIRDSNSCGVEILFCPNKLLSRDKDWIQHHDPGAFWKCVTQPDEIQTEEGNVMQDVISANSWNYREDLCSFFKKRLFGLGGKRIGFGRPQFAGCEGEAKGWEVETAWWKLLLSHLPASAKLCGKGYGQRHALPQCRTPLFIYTIITSLKTITE